MPMLGALDLAAIAEIERRWLACEIEGRASDVLDLCSADIVWLPAGQTTLRGKAAILAWLGESRERIVDIRLGDVVIDGEGPSAHRMANFRTRYVPSGSSEEVTVTGWHLWVLRRGLDSEWRVAVVAWGIVEPQSGGTPGGRS